MTDRKQRNINETYVFIIKIELIVVLVLTAILVIALCGFRKQNDVKFDTSGYHQVTIENFQVEIPESTISEETTAIPAESESPETTVSEETTTAVPETTSPKVEYVIQLTEEEFQDFCMIVAAEAGGESFEGQVAVAAVIINRIQSSKFPNTFYGVIRQKNQFATVKDGKVVCKWLNNDFSKMPQQIKDAVELALTGADPTEELLRKEAIKLGFDPEKYAEDGALFFYSPKRASEAALEARKNIKVKVQIENHVFYKVWPTKA